MLGALVGNSALNAYYSVRNLRDELRHQMDGVAAALSRGRFPLTDAVLMQAAEISGAEFQVVGGAGEVHASSQFDWPPPRATSSSAASLDFSLSEKTRIGARTFFHRSVILQPSVHLPKSAVLHVFYPVDSYQDALEKALTPLAITAVVTMALVGVLATIGAARITIPLRRLRGQCEQIACGEFRPLRLPQRNDEIRDLGISINKMASMLAKFEEQVRRNERLRALGQIQAGLAHQLRNAATGCRMALEFHEREFPGAKQSETLAVAMRQLALIDRCLRRFFASDAVQASPHTRINLVDVVENVLNLVRPAAAHVGVLLEEELPRAPVYIDGDLESLQQLVGNLVLNALEASSPTAHLAPRSTCARVIVRVDVAGGERAALEVSDTGAGPTDDVADAMFEPLVTGRPDGVGIGLSVAQDVARRHNAEICWERKGGWTRFFLELKLSCQEKGCVEPARR
ncbi:MAG: HAMP domain-containing histidine kinase [Planctomycetales bacterium]|nr:HAMP domain-containing histidine kinase [Planctomycetales bacterium]